MSLSVELVASSKCSPGFSTRLGIYQPAVVELPSDPTRPMTPGRGKLRETAWMRVTPHVAPNLSGRRVAIDDCTTSHPGYAISQPIRKQIDAPFGWIKATAELRKTRHRGLGRVG